MEPVRPIYIKAGETVKLSCKLSQSNLNDGVWSLNDTPVLPSARVKVGFSGQEQYIIIQPVTQADRGVYTYTVGHTFSVAHTSTSAGLHGSYVLHIEVYK